MPYDTWKPREDSIKFFEDVLKSHRKVAYFTKRGYYVFDIERREGLGPVVALLTDLYTVGLADVVLAETEVEGLNCIVTVSNWNGYTQEAKEYGIEHRTGLFQLSEFMGALWQRDFWNYVKRDEEGNPTYPYRGRSA